MKWVSTEYSMPEHMRPIVFITSDGQAKTGTYNMFWSMFSEGISYAWTPNHVEAWVYVDELLKDYKENK